MEFLLLDVLYLVAAGLTLWAALSRRAVGPALAAREAAVLAIAVVLALACGVVRVWAVVFLGWS